MTINQLMGVSKLMESMRRKNMNLGAECDCFYLMPSGAFLGWVVIEFSLFIWHKLSRNELGGEKKCREFSWSIFVTFFLLFFVEELSTPQLCFNFP